VLAWLSRAVRAGFSTDPEFRVLTRYDDNLLLQAKGMLLLMPSNDPTENEAHMDRSASQGFSPDSVRKRTNSLWWCRWIHSHA
jgi:hypothetical protein